MLDAPAQARGQDADYAGMATSTRAQLVLRPDWARPAQWLPQLATYVAGTPADADACLYVDASGGELSLDAVAEILTLATQACSGGRPFAEVVVLDDPDEAAALDSVPAPEAPVAADATLERVLRVKALAAELTAIADRDRFEGTPAPSPRGTPLVSVRIATWRTQEALLDRTIPSVLGDPYGNVEIVVCSDGPDPAARAAVEGVGDERVRYIELERRPAYPEHRKSLWFTAGSPAMNASLAACRGDFVMPLDHDDAFVQGRFHHMLELAARTGADFVYGQALCELPDGGWVVNGAPQLVRGGLAHSAVMFSRRLAHMRLDVDGWVGGEPGDWNFFRRLRDTGATIAHLPHPVLVHFRERTAIGADRKWDLSDPTAEELLADVARSDARWLLSVPLP